MNRYVFTLGDETFTIYSDEQESLLQAAAARVEHHLQRAEAPQLSSEQKKKQFACLALSCSFESIKVEERLRQLEEQIDKTIS